MRGAPFKRCGCKDANRKNLNSRCPRLKERDHGGWYYRYSEPAGPDGKRRQPIIGPFQTKKAAEADQIERLDKLNKGLYGIADRSLTVAVDFDRWLEGKAKLTKSTRDSYEEAGRLYIKPGLGYLRLDDLRSHHIEDLYAAIRSLRSANLEKRATGIGRRLLDARGTGASSRRPVSKARLHRIHAVIHAYLADRQRKEMIPRNWAEHVDAASGRGPQALVWTDERVERWLRTGKRPSRVMVWTPEQTGLFLDFAAENRLYPMWHFIAFRGPRRGEACRLERSELSLQRRTVTIRTSRDDDYSDVERGDLDGRPTTKNHKSRTLALDKETVEVLRAHLDHQNRLKQELGDLYQDSGFVFTTEDGRPLNLDTVSQHFDRLIARYEAIRRSPERAGGKGVPRTPAALAKSYRMPERAVRLALNGPPLPPIRLHDLRHVAACLTYRATKDLKLVSQLMGHSGIQITADIYTRLFEEIDHAAAEAVVAIVPRAYRANKPGPSTGDH